MIDIKHQPDRVLVKVWYQTSTGMQFWMSFDIKHQPHRVLVDFLYQTSTRNSFGWCLTKTVFSYKQKWWSPVKKVSKLYTFFENTYPEMQRKRMPRLNEYQSRRGKRRSDAPPEPPCPPGAGDVGADLVCGRSPPGHQGPGLMPRSGAGMFFFAFQGV